MKHKSGTVDHSSRYRENLLAFCTIRCVLSPEICGFQVFSSLEGFGNLDDIIMIVEYADASVKAFVFQLKHKTTRRLNKDMLLNAKGDFSLMKYEHSYEEILQNKRETNSVLRDIDESNITLIIFTNMLFVNSDNDMIRLKLIEDNKYNWFINTSKKSKVFQIENGKQTLFHPQFLKQLLLYTSQLNSDELENSISEILKDEFREIKKESVLAYIQYISDWIYGRLGKPYPLSYKEIEMKLLEIIVQPFIVIPNITSDILEIKNRWTSWNRAVMTSDLTLLFENKSLEFICEAAVEQLKSNYVWDVFINGRIFEDVSTNNRIVKKVLIRRKRVKGELNASQIYMTLWELKQLPLILHCLSPESLDVIIKALRVFSRTVRKYVIICEQMSLDRFTELDRVYRMFSDLNSIPNKVALNILNKIEVSLQNKKPINLKDLLSDDINEAKFLTTDMVVQINSRTVTIGKRFDDLDFYIERQFKKVLLTRDVLSEQNSLFILYVKSNFTPCVKNILNKTCYMNYDDFITHIANDSSTVVNIQVLFLKESQKDLLFATSIKKINEIYQVNKSVHLLEYLEEFDVFQWIDSIGTVRDIRNYLVKEIRNERYYVKEHEALNYYSAPLQIFSGTAGMGKTTVLKYITNTSSADLWVFYLDVFSNQKKINLLQNEVNDVKILMNFLDLSTEHSKFSEKMVEVLIKTGRVIFFVDELFEFALNTKIHNFIKLLMQLCSKYNNRLWLVCRSNIKIKVENCFNRISIELIELNENDQLQFLERHLGKKYSHETYKTFINKIYCALGKNLSGIILQWKLILSTVLKKDLEKLIQSDDLAIDLFRESIEMNSEYYVSNKESNNIMMYKMALSVVFQDDILREIIDFDEFLRLKETFIRETKASIKQFIVTGFNKNAEPEFVDGYYVDFLVAYWLVQNIRRDTVKQLIAKLFYPELMMIKRFFDLLICAECPLHKAVISGNLVRVKNIVNSRISCDPKLLTDTDICNRTVLHLAAANGVHFDFRTASDIVGIRSIGKHCEAFKFDIYTELSVPSKVDTANGCGEKVFLYLLERVKEYGTKILFKHDKIGFNVFDHAYRSGCLYNLNALVCLSHYNKLAESQNVFFLRHCYDNNLFSIIQQATFDCFCSVRVGRRLMLDDLKKANFVFGMLQKCCEAKLYNKVGVDENLASQDDTTNMEDTKNINLKFLETNTSWDGDFHRAARDCDFNKLQEMVSNRLDDEINTLSPASFTALLTLVCNAVYFSNVENFIKCAELLIDNGIDINHPDIHNQSVILHAAVRKYKHFVNFLINKCRDHIDIDNYKQHGGESARKVILKHNLYQGKLPEQKQIFDTKKLLLSSIKGNNEAQFFALIEQDDVLKYLNTGDGKNDDISAYTLLQLCLVKNLHSFAKKLIEKGADCFKTIQKNKKTPVEYALMKHNYELVKIIFDKYDVKDKIDADLLNHRNEMGRTLLHEATFRCHFDFILKLIESGASLFVSDNQGKIPLDTIHKSILSEHLDNCIDYDSDDDPENVDIEYKTLIDYNPKKKKIRSQYDCSYSNLEALVAEDDIQEIDETKILAVIRRSPELEDLFSHPVIRALIDVKLNKMIWIHHINLSFYALFWFLLHINTLDQNMFILALLFLLTVLLNCRQLFHFIVSPEKNMYFLQVENIIEIAVLIVTYAVIYVELTYKLNPLIQYNWLYITSMLFSTIELLFLVGKNYFVHSIMTYRYILAKFIKYIAPFSLLFVTFTLSYQLLLLKYEDYNSGNIFYDLFVKLFIAILMFSGELKEEYLYQDANVVFGRIIVVLFVFIMSTVLANMLLTLLVNDMDEMRHSAMIRQYSEKTKYILNVERFFNYVKKGDSCFTRFLNCFIDSYCSKGSRFNVFIDSSQIEVNLRKEKILSKGTVRRLRKKINTLIELNRTREHQKIRDIKRLIDKIVSSPDFFYKDI